MILFILIAIGIALYTIFADGWLIDSNKHIEKNNKVIKTKIELGNTNYNTFTYRKYNKNDYESILKNILSWFFINIMFNVVNFILVFIISAIVVSCYPKEESYYTFNINALNDNLTTRGEIHGTAFYKSGSFDGELSYFFSRTMNNGEIIGHIPANKSYINYDENRKPCIEVHQENHKIPKFIDKFLFAKWCNDKFVNYYVIIVPNGTISVDGAYEIDME